MNETLKQVVEEVLKYNLKARDDDLALFIAVCLRLGHATLTTDGVHFSYDNYQDIPKPSSVERIRRHFQHDLKMYQASEEVEEKREKHREATRVFFSQRKISADNYPGGHLTWP